MRDAYVEFDQAQADTAWAFLNDGINKINEKQSFTLSYEELYRNAYYLILHRYGDMTYKNLTRALEQNITKYFQKLNSLQDEDFLIHLQNIWFDAKLMIKIIKNIFLYMDKNYVPLKDSSVKPVLILGYEIFKKLLLNKERQLFDKFQREILSIIKNERDGFHIDRILVKNLLHMLIELGTQVVRVKPNTVYGYSSYARENPSIKEVPSKDIYKNYFENEFIADTKQYYDAEAQNFIKSMTCSEYLRQAEKRLNEEKDRMGFYLDSSTEPALIATFVRSYIVQNCKILIEMENSGLYFLLREEKHEEVKRMFRLFTSNSESFELFLTAFTEYISKSLESLMTDEEIKKDPLKMMASIIDFHSKINRVTLNFDSKQSQFAKVISSTFEFWLNKYQFVNYNLNLYLDYSLKQDFMYKSETEIDQSLSKMMDLFKHLREKDLFEKFYKNFLSKRLLEDRSLSEEYEKLAIEKLRKECGPFYTSKLEIMFKDIAISKQTLANFHAKSKKSNDSKEPQAASAIEVDIRMLTQGSWPIIEMASCVLSQELKNYILNYEKFYVTYNPGKSIKWVTNYGSAHLKVSFEDRKKEFVMTTHQMCICLLFNDRNKLLISEIQDFLQIPMEEIKHTLEPLIMLKLFKKDNKEEEILPKDTVSFNPDFNHKSYKIKVPAKKRKVAEKQAEDSLVQAVQSERKHTLEATVVRIMKSRKMMDHTALVEEVIKYSSLNQFTPDVPFIKQVLENLISREYLDRSSDNKNIYVYLS